MMKHFLLLTTILLSILFYTSCTSVKPIVVNVQKPALIILPPGIQKLGIVNNAVPQPPSFGYNRVSYNEKGERELIEVEIPSDSTTIILAETIFEELSDIGYFDEVVLYEIPLRDDLSFSEYRRIDSLEAIELADIMDVDAILSLDRFLIGSLYQEEPYSFEVKGKILDVKMDAVFHFYSKNGNKISSPFHYRDSIYWESVYQGETLISPQEFPDLKDAVHTAARYAGSKIADSFIPSWVEESRVYYGDVKEANKLADADNWEKARELWMEAFDREESSKKKARLASNIALAYELSDDLKEALKWAQTAVDLFDQTLQTSVDQNNRATAFSYYEHLIDRYKEFKILDLRDRKEE